MTPNEFDQQFSARLHQWMKYRGIEPDRRACYLSREAGIDPRTARRYLAGGAPRDVRRLATVAKAIGAPIDALTCDAHECAFHWLCYGLSPAQLDQFRRLLMRYRNSSKKAQRALAMAGDGRITFDQALAIGGN